MKKLLLSALLLLCGLAPAHADGHEEPITFDRLPQAAQTFLKAPFRHADGGLHRGRPEVYGCRVRGEIHRPHGGRFPLRRTVGKRGRKYAPRSAAIVPKQISDFVAANELFGRQFIKKIERDPYTWEIELSGGLEIKFDTKFNVIGYDD